MLMVRAWARELSQRQHRSERRLAPALRRLERAAAIQVGAARVELVEAQHELGLLVAQNERLRGIRGRGQEAAVRPLEHLEASVFTRSP